eukprot:783668-Rhodomonas_salina.2
MESERPGPEDDGRVDEGVEEEAEEREERGGECERERGEREEDEGREEAEERAEERAGEEVPEEDAEEGEEAAVGGRVGVVEECAGEEVEERESGGDGPPGEDEREADGEVEERERGLEEEDGEGGREGVEKIGPDQVKGPDDALAEEPGVGRALEAAPRLADQGPQRPEPRAHGLHADCAVGHQAARVGVDALGGEEGGRAEKSLHGERAAPEGDDEEPEPRLEDLHRLLPHHREAPSRIPRVDPVLRVLLRGVPHFALHGLRADDPVARQDDGALEREAALRLKRRLHAPPRTLLDAALAVLRVAREQRARKVLLERQLCLREAARRHAQLDVEPPPVARQERVALPQRGLRLLAVRVHSSLPRVAALVADGQEVEPRDQERDQRRRQRARRCFRQRRERCELQGEQLRGHRFA